MAGRFFPGNNVNKEIKHVGLGQRRGDVRPLQGSPLVLLRVDPGAHRQLRDEDVAPLGEEDRRLRRDHFHLRIRLHHLLDPRQWQLVDLVVVRVRLQVVDCLLPVSSQDVAVLSV